MPAEFNVIMWDVTFNWIVKDSIVKCYEINVNWSVCVQNVRLLPWGVKTDASLPDFAFFHHDGEYNNQQNCYIARLTVSPEGKLVPTLFVVVPSHLEGHHRKVERHIENFCVLPLSNCCRCQRHCSPKALSWAAVNDGKKNTSNISLTARVSAEMRCNI